MASHSLDPDHFIGFRFAPTKEELIRIINNKNAGKYVHPMFTVYDDLFGRPPEPLEECYCLTKLELGRGNKVNRTLRDDTRRYWKNIKSDFVRDDNNVVGWVTQLRLHWGTNSPTEWHIRAYSDTEMPEAGRYVLCRVYKLEKKNDSGRGDENQAQCSNTHPQDALVSNSQQVPSCPNQIDNLDFITQFLLDDGEMNQVQHYEMGQCSFTEQDCLFNAATYEMGECSNTQSNQDQIYGVDCNSQQFTSNNTYSIGGNDMYPNQDSNSDTFGDFAMVDWNGYLNPDQSSNIN